MSYDVIGHEGHLDFPRDSCANHGAKVILFGKQTKFRVKNDGTQYIYVIFYRIVI